MLAEAMGDVTWVNRYADYGRFLDAITAAKQSAGVKNTATAFGLLLDLADKRSDRIAKPGHKAAAGQEREDGVPKRR